MCKLKKNILTSGKYLNKVDRVMTQVDRITEDIAHMPVAAFIFRDNESDEVHYSTDIRFYPKNSNELKLKQIFVEKGTICRLLW